MQISVTDAEGKLDELVRRAEAGDEVILTSGGEPKVRLTPVAPAESADDVRERRREDRERLLDALQGAGRKDFGPDAAHAADWLYDDNGLPA